MKYEVGDELYLRCKFAEGPVRVTHCGSKFFNIDSDEIFYVVSIEDGIERAVHKAHLFPLTKVGACAP